MFASASGIISLCSHLEVVESKVTLHDIYFDQEGQLSAKQIFTPDTLVLSAITFYHIAMIWERHLFGDERPLNREWIVEFTTVFTVDVVSVIVVAAETSTKV